MRAEGARRLRDTLMLLSDADRRKALDRLDEDERHALRNFWEVWAHQAQQPPAGYWHTWLIMAGRGFGKTRAGAEWVRAAAREPAARIALVASTLGEARRVMIEGESGLLAIAPRGKRPRFEPSKRTLTWESGAQATLYSAAEPESLRGPQHSHAWCDEIGKWELTGGRAEAAWDNLLLGLRLGREPRVVATTTPRSVPLVRRLVKNEAWVTHGTTFDNAANLADGFIRAAQREFGESTWGRQELYGELIEDLAGALWTRSLLEQCREAASGAAWKRVVIGVDPPASAAGDACGIVVCALGEDGIARVLADASVEKAAPERWARAVAQAASAWRADRVVAEVNQGGDMVATVLRAARIALPVKQVRATRGKTARAEPVAALYEAGRVRHAGLFPVLEDQLCGLMAAGEYRGPGSSPDRADAAVWALTELMLGQRGEPRIWAG